MTESLYALQEICKEYTYYDTYCYYLCRDFLKKNDKSRKWLVVMSKLPETETNEDKKVYIYDKLHTEFFANKLKVIKIIDIYFPHSEIKKIITETDYNGYEQYTNLRFKYEVNEIIRVHSKYDHTLPMRIGYFITLEGAYYDRQPPKKFTGLWHLWRNIDGCKLSERYYKNGRLNGTKTFFHDNGRKETEEIYKNGKRAGRGVCWYANGTKERETNYKNGKREGIEVYWYENGMKERETNYKNGKREGIEVYWYDSGAKKSEVNYKNDKKEGTELHWYENGEKAVSDP